MNKQEKKKPAAVEFREGDFVWCEEFGYGLLDLMNGNDVILLTVVNNTHVGVKKEQLYPAKYRAWSYSDCVQAVGRVFLDDDNYACLASRMREHEPEGLQLFIEGHEWVSVSELASSADKLYGWRYYATEELHLLGVSQPCAIATRNMNGDLITWVR